MRAMVINNHRATIARGCETQRARCPHRGLVKCDECLQLVCGGPGGLMRHCYHSTARVHVTARGPENLSAMVLEDMAKAPLTIHPVAP